MVRIVKMKKSGYSQSLMLERLEEVASRLDIVVSYEKGIEGPGGFCRVKDQAMVLINKDLALRDRIEVLADVLKTCQLDDIYILPEVREYLECLRNNVTKS
ncbi:hypothetical protein JXQ70_15440 [bacterium]|nr:hypothetical protein [bacterium]